MEFKDYYNVMGVARDATEAQIKQAYRKLARKYHPDVSKEKDAEARFKEVGEAYEVLKSPEKRAAYDRLGKDYRPGEDFRPPPNWDSGFEFSGAGPGNPAYSDFFDALFGAQARSGGAHRRGFHAEHGEDHHAKVLLDLEASLNGGARAFTLQMPEIDPEGRLVSKERTLNRASCQREFSPDNRSVSPVRAPAHTATENRAISILRWIFSLIRCIGSRAGT